MNAISSGARRRMLAALALAERPGTAGERQAAEQALGRMMVSNASMIRGALTAPPPRQMPLMGTWRETCRLCLQHPRGLRKWEVGFLTDLPKFPRISTKQRYVLNEIAERLGVLDATRQ